MTCLPWVSSAFTRQSSKVTNSLHTLLDKLNLVLDETPMRPTSDRPAIPSPLIGLLENRDCALWLCPVGEEPFDAIELSRLCALPWSVVLSEVSDAEFISQLETSEPINDPLVRRRGLIHVVDSDPSESVLPPRHLAVNLLNGRSGARITGLAAMTRRLTMLQDLRRRSIRQLVVVVPGRFQILARDVVVRMSANHHWWLAHQ